MKPKTIYIATPVTSRPEGTDHQKWLAASLREMGLEDMWNNKKPSDYLSHKFRSFATETKPGMTDAEAMGACVKALLECDAILVDDATECRSKGVAAEQEVASVYGLDIFYVTDLMKKEGD